IATVLELFGYAVESARAIARSRVRVGASGFEWDRQWMLVDGKGTFLSQRTHPRLARIVPEITASALVLRAEGAHELSVPLDTRGDRVAVRVWDDACDGLDQGAAANAWASRLLGEAVRLVRASPGMVRPANVKFAHPTPAPLAFSDGYPLPVLRKFRFDRSLRGATFGENAVIADGAGGEIERGSRCRVMFDSLPAFPT